MSHTHQWVSIHVICSSEQRLELAVAMSDAVIPLSRSVKSHFIAYTYVHTGCIHYISCCLIGTTDSQAPLVAVYVYEV